MLRMQSTFMAGFARQCSVRWAIREHFCEVCRIFQLADLREKRGAVEQFVGLGEARVVAALGVRSP